MNLATTTRKFASYALVANAYWWLFLAFIAGLIFPLGFAPFHKPGAVILSLAFLFGLLHKKTFKQSVWIGALFGLGYSSVGVSWVYVSIKFYGELPVVIAGLITLLFLAFLSCYSILVCATYHQLNKSKSALGSCLLFTALWCFGEYLRSTLFGGFPWLLVGFSQVDTPIKYILPWFGLYGAGFVACFAATMLTMSFQNQHQRYLWLIALVLLLLAPGLLKNIPWSTSQLKPISVAVIQPNLSMRNKWNESLFWELIRMYQANIDDLIGKANLIVLPESAIPLPQSYISDLIQSIHEKAKADHSALLVGMFETSSIDANQYYNAMVSLGQARGDYLKQHLVPFGEFIPRPFNQLVTWLTELQSSNMIAGKVHQRPIRIFNYPIASLICYELAYPELLRQQLPQAQWIVTISDDGWFGHSFAMYQQLQMAQAMSIQTARYQIMANNDGLSSLINSDGDVVASLPAYTMGVLEASLYPTTGSTPWVRLGDTPILLLCACIIAFALRFPIAAKLKRRYPYHPK